MAPRVSKGSAKTAATTDDAPPADLHVPEIQPAPVDTVEDAAPVEEVDDDPPSLLDEYDDDDDEYDLHGDIEGDIDDGHALDMFDPLQQLTQLFLTEEGVPIADILQGIRDALEKQSKILFKISNILDQRTAK